MVLSAASKREIDENTNQDPWLAHQLEKLFLKMLPFNKNSTIVGTGATTSFENL